MSIDRPHDPLVLERLGSRLEARRRELVKSAREVAQGAEISPVYLRVIETGVNPKTGRASRPSAEVLVRIARELDMDADDLLSSAGYRDLRAEHVVRSTEVPTPDAKAPELTPALRGIADAIELARTRPSDFMRSVMAEDLSRFEAHIAAVAGGSLLCGPGEEPRVRTLALVDACHRSLQALSFEDDEWWLGAKGTGYLDLHDRMRGRSPRPTMTRIFLLTPAQCRAYEAVLARQENSSVEVLVADPIDVPEVCRRDLEIYDSSLLREAVSSSSQGGGRLAEFTDDHARLQRAEAAFATVRRVARRVGE